MKHDEKERERRTQKETTDMVKRLCGQKHSKHVMAMQ